MTHTAPDPLHEEELESRWEAAPAVAVVIALQLVVAVASRAGGDWQLWVLPWWVWLLPVVPELVLLVALAWDPMRHQLEQIGHRRTVSVALLGVISFTNAFLLLALIGSLVNGTERSGAQLLVKGGAVWATNTITFALWFWAVDRGGPVRRIEANPPLPDFQFPQMENPEFAEPGWDPRLADYIYVSFTNSIAFSPTDAMPLTHRAKFLMLSESAISAVTILFVAARAVNILT